MVLDDLRAVDALLNDESKWSQNHFAMDKNSNPCDPLSPDATMWCLLGAIKKVTNTDDPILADEFRNTIASLFPEQDTDLAVFNDNTTFPVLKGVIDITIWCNEYPYFDCGRIGPIQFNDAEEIDFAAVKALIREAHRNL
jgi:hypothetical protein